MGDEGAGTVQHKVERHSHPTVLYGRCSNINAKQELARLAELYLVHNPPRSYNNRASFQVVILPGPGLRRKMTQRTAAK